MYYTIEDFQRKVMGGIPRYSFIQIVKIVKKYVPKKETQTKIIEYLKEAKKEMSRELATIERRLKTGDLVAYVYNYYGDEKSNPLWGGKYGKIIGTVIRINEEYERPRHSCNVDVRWTDLNTGNNYNSKTLMFVRPQK